MLYIYIYVMCYCVYMTYEWHSKDIPTSCLGAVHMGAPWHRGATNCSVTSNVQACPVRPFTATRASVNASMWLGETWCNGELLKPRVSRVLVEQKQVRKNIFSELSTSANNQLVPVTFWTGIVWYNLETFCHNVSWSCFANSFGFSNTSLPIILKARPWENWSPEPWNSLWPPMLRHEASTSKASWDSGGHLHKIHGWDVVMVKNGSNKYTLRTINMYILCV